MPVNAGPKYFVAEKKYLEARNKEEKITALEEMIKALPKHKSSGNVLAQLKKRLAVLKRQKSTKASPKPRFIIRKEGTAQICIIGLTNSGKSTLLNSLTQANVEVADYPYTTTKPKVGMMMFEDVQLQLIEIPSTFDPDVMSIVRTCDEIVITLKDKTDKNRILGVLKNNGIGDKKIITVANKKDIDNLGKKIWSGLGLIRVYTKSPGKKKVPEPLTLKPNSTVRQMARNVHKDFLKDFNFARVFNPTPFSGHKVGLDYKLKDMDIVEIHTK